MSMKRTYSVTATGTDVVVKVHRDSENMEYRVAVFKGGKRDPAKDYFTQDRTDAISTAWAMARPYFAQRSPTDKE